MSLGNTWKRELNTQNPLGHKGHIAQVYADLLHNIYDGSQYSYTPRQFKTTLGKFAPMFSGYGQQDSQEFMSFLVDGLHEDLNRILKKPYIENPESDDNTVNDLGAIRELGQKYRDIYQARNSSVITDLFSGSYKNKLVCPVCNKISINFDPFLLLTLQLPLEHHWEFTFTFVPLKAKPYNVRIDNSKGATIRSLKEFVADRIAGTAPSKLLMTEIFSQKLYRVMEDQISLPEANIQTRDDMVIYELEDEPTNWPSPPKKFRSMLEVDAKEDTPPQKDVNEHQLVMIQHRSVSQHSYSHNKNIVLWPTFITVTKDEVSNYDEILRKILRAVSNQTQRDLDELVESAARNAESDDTDSDSPPEYVEGNMSVDEEKAEDSNIKTESLDDEDFVDVKMTNSDDSQNDTEPISPSQSPHWLEKGAPIPDVLRNLFEVCAVQASDPLPTGYTQPDWNRSYSPIRERIPKPAPEPEDSDKSTNSPEPMDASEDEATEDTNDQQNDDVSQMSIVESEGESASYVKPGSSRNRKHPRGGKKGKQNQKHSNKGRRHTPPKHLHKKIVPMSHDDEHASGDERLIRNNEMIILDWKAEAFHALFESQRGGDAKKSMFLLEDAELDKRAEQRESRRKRGMNLEECFEETSKAEVLTEDNAWYCPNCKERRLASKQLELWTVPDILVIHLKRFSSGRGLRDKIDALVDFPVEGLDLSGRVGVDEGNNLIYDLFAVDNHYGGLGGGHYTAFAKNFYDDDWYEYNGE
jgi:ubiquitin carboxyl-terminal hydrolase 4/11